jgi:hypothetical protein
MLFSIFDRLLKLEEYMTMKKHANILEAVSYQFNKKFLVKIPKLKNGFLDKTRVTDIKYLDINGILSIGMTIDGIPMIYKKSVKLVKFLEQSIVIEELPVVEHELEKGEFLSEDKL